MSRAPIAARSGGGLAIDNGTLNHVTLYGNTASPINASESWGGNAYEPQNGGGTTINNLIIAGGSASEGPNCLFNNFGSNPEDNRDDLEEAPAADAGSRRNTARCSTSAHN
jgi:hypothetical protein